jgi:hypothetical protein
MEPNLDNNLEAWTQLKSALTENIKTASAESPSDYECKDSAVMFFILRKEKAGEQPVAVSLVYDPAANTLKIGYSWRKEEPEIIQLHQPDVQTLQQQIISAFLAANT